jgi:hypothetical protein
MLFMTMLESSMISNALFEHSAAVVTTAHNKSAASGIQVRQPRTG